MNQYVIYIIPSSIQSLVYKKYESLSSSCSFAFLFPLGRYIDYDYYEESRTIASRKKDDQNKRTHLLCTHKSPFDRIQSVPTMYTIMICFTPPHLTFNEIRHEFSHKPYYKSNMYKPEIRFARISRNQTRIA